MPIKVGNTNTGQISWQIREIGDDNTITIDNWRKMSDVLILNNLNSANSINSNYSNLTINYDNKYVVGLINSNYVINQFIDSDGLFTEDEYIISLNKSNINLKNSNINLEFIDKLRIYNKNKDIITSFNNSSIDYDYDINYYLNNNNINYINNLDQNIININNNRLNIDCDVISKEIYADIIRPNNPTAGIIIENFNIEGTKLTDVNIGKFNSNVDNLPDKAPLEISINKYNDFISDSIFQVTKYNYHNTNSDFNFEDSNILLKINSDGFLNIGQLSDTAKDSFININNTYNLETSNIVNFEGEYKGDTFTFNKYGNLVLGSNINNLDSIVYINRNDDRLNLDENNIENINLDNPLLKINIDFEEKNNYLWSIQKGKDTVGKTFYKIFNSAFFDPTADNENTSWLVGINSKTQLGDIEISDPKYTLYKYNYVQVFTKDSNKLFHVGDADNTERYYYIMDKEIADYIDCNISKIKLSKEYDVENSQLYNNLYNEFNLRDSTNQISFNYKTISFANTSYTNKTINQTLFYPDKIYFQSESVTKEINLNIIDITNSITINRFNPAFTDRASDGVDLSHIQLYLYPEYSDTDKHLDVNADNYDIFRSSLINYLTINDIFNFTSVDAVDDYFAGNAGYFERFTNLTYFDTVIDNYFFTIHISREFYKFLKEKNVFSKYDNFVKDIINKPNFYEFTSNNMFISSFTDNGTLVFNEDDYINPIHNKINYEDIKDFSIYSKQKNAIFDKMHINTLKSQSGNTIDFDNNNIININDLSFSSKSDILINNIKLKNIVSNDPNKEISFINNNINFKLPIYGLVWIKTTESDLDTTVNYNEITSDNFDSYQLLVDLINSKNLVNNKIYLSYTELSENNLINKINHNNYIKLNDTDYYYPETIEFSKKNYGEKYKIINDSLPNENYYYNDIISINSIDNNIIKPSVAIYGNNPSYILYSSNENNNGISYYSTIKYEGFNKLSGTTNDEGQNEKKYIYEISYKNNNTNDVIFEQNNSYHILQHIANDYDMITMGKNYSFCIDNKGINGLTGRKWKYISDSEPEGEEITSGDLDLYVSLNAISISIGQTFELSESYFLNSDLADRIFKPTNYFKTLSPPIRYFKIVQDTFSEIISNSTNSNFTVSIGVPHKLDAINNLHNYPRYFHETLKDSDYMLNIYGNTKISGIDGNSVALSVKVNDYKSTDNTYKTNISIGTDAILNNNSNTFTIDGDIYSDKLNYKDDFGNYLNVSNVFANTVEDITSNIIPHVMSYTYIHTSNLNNNFNTDTDVDNGIFNLNLIPLIPYENFAIPEVPYMYQRITEYYHIDVDAEGKVNEIETNPYKYLQEYNDDMFHFRNDDMPFIENNLIDREDRGYHYIVFEGAENEDKTYDLKINDEIQVEYLAVGGGAGGGLIDKKYVGIHWRWRQFDYDNLATYNSDRETILKVYTNEINGNLFNQNIYPDATYTDDNEKWNTFINVLNDFTLFESTGQLDYTLQELDDFFGNYNFGLKWENKGNVPPDRGILLNNDDIKSILDTSTDAIITLTDIDPNIITKIPKNLNINHYIVNNNGDYFQPVSDTIRNNLYKTCIFLEESESKYGFYYPSIESGGSGGEVRISTGITFSKNSDLTITIGKGGQGSGIIDYTTVPHDDIRSATNIPLQSSGSDTIIDTKLGDDYRIVINGGGIDIIDSTSYTNNFNFNDVGKDIGLTTYPEDIYTLFGFPFNNDDITYTYGLKDTTNKIFIAGGGGGKNDTGNSLDGGKGGGGGGGASGNATSNSGGGGGFGEGLWGNGASGLIIMRYRFTEKYDYDDLPINTDKVKSYLEFDWDNQQWFLNPYVANTSNDLVNRIILTSNQISRNIYNTSNNLISHITQSTSNLLDNIVDTSNYIYDVHTNQKNFIIDYQTDYDIIHHNISNLDASFVKTSELNIDRIPNIPITKFQNLDLYTLYSPKINDKILELTDHYYKINHYEFIILQYNPNPDHNDGDHTKYTVEFQTDCEIDVLIIGGGGAGGSSQTGGGAGGGGGGYIKLSNLKIIRGSKDTISVGRGGIAGHFADKGNGVSTSAFECEAFGGSKPTYEGSIPNILEGGSKGGVDKGAVEKGESYRYFNENIAIDVITSQSTDTSKGGDFITSTAFPAETTNIVNYDTVQDNIEGNDGIATSIFNNELANGASTDYDTTWCGGGGAARKYYQYTDSLGSTITINNESESRKYGNLGSGGLGGGGPGAADTSYSDKTERFSWGGNVWIKSNIFETISKEEQIDIDNVNNNGHDGLSGTGGGGGGGYDRGGNGGSGIVIIRINNKSGALDDGTESTKVIPERGDRQKGYLSFNYNSFSWQMNPLDAINLDFDFDTIYSNIVNISNNLAIDINERLYNNLHSLDSGSTIINPRIMTNGSFANYTIEARHIFGFNKERFANESGETVGDLYDLNDESYWNEDNTYYNYLLKGSKLMSRSITNNNFVDNTITPDKIVFPLDANKLALASISDNNISGTIDYPVKIVPSEGNFIDISKFNNAYIDIDSLQIQEEKFDGTVFITSNENSISKINLNNLSNIIIDIDSLNTDTTTFENSSTHIIADQQNTIPLNVFTNLYIDYNLIEGYGTADFKFNSVNLYSVSEYKIPENYLDNIYIDIVNIDANSLINTTAYLNTADGSKISPDIIGNLEITPDQIDTSDPDNFFSRATIVTTADNKINPTILPNVELSPDDLDFNEGTLNDVRITRTEGQNYIDAIKINNSYINYNDIDLTTDKLNNVAIEAQLNSINPNTLQDIKVYPNSINFDFVSGLEWYELDSQPTFGSEIQYNFILNALLDVKLSFTQAEWETTGITDLNKDNYVNTNGKYYKPKRYSIPTNIITDDDNKLYVSNIESLTIKPEQINNLDVVGARIILDDTSEVKIDPLQLDGALITITADQLLTGPGYKLPADTQYNFGPNSIDPQLLPAITITSDMINASSANKLNNVTIDGDIDVSILGTGIIINGDIVSTQYSDKIDSVTITKPVEVRYINLANIINDVPIIGEGKISGITNIYGGVDINYINDTIIDLTSVGTQINSLPGDKFSGTTTIYGNIDANLIDNVSITLGDTTSFLPDTSLSGNVTITGVVPATVISSPVEIKLSGGVIDANDFILDNSINSSKIANNIELSFSKVKFQDDSFFVNANYIKLENATTYDNNILTLYAYKSLDATWTNFELPFKVESDNEISFITRPFYNDANYSKLELKDSTDATNFEIRSYNTTSDRDSSLGDSTIDSDGANGGTIIKNKNNKINFYIYNNDESTFINAMEFNKNFNKSFKPLHVSEIEKVNKIKFSDNSELTTAPNLLNSEKKLVMNNSDSGFNYSQSEDGETGEGFIHCNGIHAEFNITAYSIITASDLNLKTDIKQLDLNIDNILRLNPVSFKWKDSAKNNNDNFGFIAQELEQLFPELITNNGNNYKAVNYIGLIPHLVKHIQNLETRLQKLEKKL